MAIFNDLLTGGINIIKKDRTLACMQISSAVMMMILTPSVFKEKLGFAMHDEGQRRQFLTRLVDRLLTP